MGCRALRCATKRMMNCRGSCIRGELSTTLRAGDATIRHDCLAIRAKQQPDEWTTFNAQSMLGEALYGQKKFAEAEPLLVQGYVGMKERAPKIPNEGKHRLAEALVRLVQLYDASGKPHDATRWRKELETAKADAKSPDKP